jgi:hypothetical protein
MDETLKNMRVAMERPIKLKTCIRAHLWVLNKKKNTHIVQKKSNHSNPKIKSKKVREGFFAGEFFTGTFFAGEFFADFFFPGGETFYAEGFIVRMILHYYNSPLV